MTRCIAITQNGTRCIREDKDGSSRCNGHNTFVDHYIHTHGLEKGLKHVYYVEHKIKARLMKVNPIPTRIFIGNAEELLKTMLEPFEAQWTIFERTLVQPIYKEKTKEIQDFINDKQNVHTTVAVNQTKTIVEHLLTISVPRDYVWNVYNISKTPGEIISHCKLGINAGRVMMDKYTLSDNIYEMGEGIYGKVLDGLWQYIKHSEHKKDLCKILATELKENVGQCLQGNLSRLCNVLAGYMEGVGSQESVAEILGRRFALISTRVEGIAILDELNVGDERVREEWLSAL